MLDDFSSLLKHHVVDGSNLSPNGDEDKDGTARECIGFCNTEGCIGTPKHGNEKGDNSNTSNDHTRNVH